MNNMISKFNKKELMEGKGCYSSQKIGLLWGDRRAKTVTLFQVIANKKVPLTDRLWFLTHSAGLTDAELRQLAILCAEAVLPIYEERYPNDKRPRLAIQGAKDYLAGKITADELRVLRNAAYAAATDAYAAATYAATYATADAADAAAAAAAADAAAAVTAATTAATYADATDAADAAKGTKYEKTLERKIKNWVAKLLKK